MALASWSRAPSVPVTATLSEPARSTSRMVDVEEDGASKSDHQPLRHYPPKNRFSFVVIRPTTRPHDF